METKKELRDRFLNLRFNIIDKAKKDLSIKTKVLASNNYKVCKRVFTYVNTEAEIKTIDIIKSALDDNKIVAVPKILEAKKMIFVEIKSLNDLSVGSFNILEPISSNEILSDFETIFLVPGLVFDSQNYRIGYGGGYYDRYLSQANSLAKIGLAYKFQIIDQISKDKYDIPVDFVITD